MPIFSDIAEKKGYRVISGDVALKDFDKYKNIFVIQELNARHGAKLIKKGSKGAVLTAGESPIFSYYFYDNLPKIAKNFKVRKLFKDSFKYIDKNGKNTPMYFPSFFSEMSRKPTPIDGRKFSVMVAANKGINSPLPEGIKNKIVWFIHKIYKIYSPSFRNYSQKQLHSKRIEVIKYFGERDKLDLFGSNWLDFKRFKKDDLKRLKPLLNRLNPSFCEDKIKTISDYKFTFCFENISMEGYVTEKIIDCFVAGTVPIYLGAPDICDFVPKNCFIDMRDFSSLSELDTFLCKLDENQISDYIKSAKDFLDSENGKRFSYEYFAKEMLGYIEEVDDRH